MTRIFDDPANFADDALDGFVAVHENYVARVPGGVVRSTATPDGQVAVVIGGGSGHYPAFAGVVGAGMAAGAVCGNVFTSPSASQAHSVALTAHRGGGVLFSYGNYAGDVLHFGEAERRLREQGIDARTVVVTDDIASAPPEDHQKRRGIAGDFVVFKIAGAAAERGMHLDDVERLAQSANDRTRTLGVAFSGCTLPGEAATLFSVPSGVMSIGLGIHGEAGISDQPIPSAHDLAAMLVDRLVEEEPVDAGRKVAVIVNGLGTVKYEELFILYRHVAEKLADRGLAIVEPECGELVTSLDMAGLSLTLLWLDDELEPLWRDTADTPAYRKGNLSPREHITVEAQLDAEAERAEASAPSQEAASIAARLIARALSTVEHEADHLGRLDAIAGDGDHGTGMVRGLRAADASATQSVAAHSGLTELLVAAGQAWSDKAGGTSGALWGAAIIAAGESFGGVESFTSAEIARAVQSGVAAVQSLGKAHPGDKTMVDSMLPFATSLSAGVAAQVPFGSALGTAVTLATEAAANTASLRPKLGRARPLAEKSVGHPDPGAISFALIARGIADDLATNASQKEG